MFRFAICFDFIFVYGVRKWSSFIFLHVAVQFFQCHLWKRLSSSHCVFFSALFKFLHFKAMEEWNWISWVKGMGPGAGRSSHSPAATFLLVLLAFLHLGLHMCKLVMVMNLASYWPFSRLFTFSAPVSTRSFMMKSSSLLEVTMGALYVFVLWMCLPPPLLSLPSAGISGKFPLFSLRVPRGLC